MHFAKRTWQVSIKIGRDIAPSLLFFLLSECPIPRGKLRNVDNLSRLCAFISNLFSNSRNINRFDISRKKLWIRQVCNRKQSLPQHFLYMHQAIDATAAIVHATNEKARLSARQT